MNNKPNKCPYYNEDCPLCNPKPNERDSVIMNDGIIDGIIQANTPLALALKDNQPAQEQLLELIQSIKNAVIESERKRIEEGVKKYRKFWEDGDHAVGGYISLKALSDIINNK